MAFNYGLAMRSQGVNPSMYDSNPKKARQMMIEDFESRWGKDPAAFQKEMIRQAQLERNGNSGNAAPEDQPKQEQPQQAPQQARQGIGNAMGDAPIQLPGMNPAAHFAAHGNMIAATNRAWSREMDSRREQAAAAQANQHEYQMEMLKQQGRQQAEQQQDQQGQQASQLDQIRKARNRSLLGAAGLGGHTIKSGPGGTKVTPHQFGNSPFASALLGD
jgi:hypothetical protein